MEGPRGNHLLASLPEDDRLRLSPHLRQLPLRSKQTLLRQGQPVQEIIFPQGGLSSMLKITEDGHMIEIVGIGREGAIGVGVAFGQTESPADVVVQVPDEAALALPLEAFRAELQLRGALFASIAQYWQILTMQLMQAGACNALHSADQRCSRWLLTTHDRLEGGNFPITQEMLATTLGVRRPTVTLIMADLHRAGIVHYARGMVRVIDPAALAARACECYRALSPSFSKVA